MTRLVRSIFTTTDSTIKKRSASNTGNRRRSAKNSAADESNPLQAIRTARGPCARRLTSAQSGKGQVVVSVKAAGVNFPDTLIIQGKYQFKPEPPFSPGGEVAGVIKEIGDGVTRLKRGDRVIAASTFGGFAEEMLADADKVIAMPDAMEFVPASAFVLTYGTSYHGLKNRALLKGCSIVGVFWGAFTRAEPDNNRRNNEELMQLYLAGKIKPHIHATYPLERAVEALNEVLNKRVSGKVVLTT